VAVAVAAMVATAASVVPAAGDAPRAVMRAF